MSSVARLHFIAAFLAFAVIRVTLAQTLPVDLAFSTTGSLLTPRSFHTATLLQNGKVLIAGGQDNAAVTHFIASAEIFDPSSQTFSQTGSLVKARRGHTATLLSNGNVLIAGGFN